MNVTKEELKSIQVGAVIEFAEIDWRVLQKTADAVLVISEKVLAEAVQHRMGRYNVGEVYAPQVAQ